MNTIQVLTFRYLAVDSGWGDFNAYWFRESVNNNISSGSPSTITRTLATSVNYDANLQTFSILTGFTTPFANGITELSYKLSVIRTSSTGISITISSDSSTGTVIGDFTFIEVSINTVDVLAIPGKITIGSFTSVNDGVLSYVDVGGIVREYSAIAGMSGFHLVAQTDLAWSITLTPSTSITVSSTSSFAYF